MNESPTSDGAGGDALMTHRLGFDVGGTFTDFTLVDPTTGHVGIHKTLTTPDDPAQGALDGLASLLEGAGVDYCDLDHAIHATTLVANALIEGKGALVGLITTRGYRDVLEIGTEQRYDIYDLFLRFPPPLAPRYLRRGVRERVDRDGRVLEDVDRAEIDQVLTDFRQEGVQAIAVSFLHAFRNPVNEQRVAQIIERMWPQVPVSLSSEVAPEIREFERTSTTAANAYVQPLVARYLRILHDELRAAGFTGPLYPMLSSGSTAPNSLAIKQPIRLVESGPVAGAVFAAHCGSLAGVADLLSFDMGGTTAKLCLIQGGRPAVSPDIEVGQVYRFKKGSGYPLRLPTVEMLEVGAGGGSLAWIDSLGLLKVGPASAGADPGPASYGFGGTDPTVTDADLVLGYLNPYYFLGGEMSLDVEAAHRVLGKVAEPLGLSPIDVADGIHRVVNENMASAARLHVIEKAQDPRRYGLVCFGGAGPVHAAGMARILGSPAVIVPPQAGVASAIGLLLAPPAFDYVRSFPTKLRAADWGRIEALLTEMEAQGRDLLRQTGRAGEAVVERSVDGRFEGQLHEIQLSLPEDVREPQLSEFEARFQEEYRRLYRHLPGEIPIELLTWRVRVAAEPDWAPDAQGLSEATSTRDAGSARKGAREAYFGELESFVETPIYDRYLLVSGMRFSGPALAEERESTTVIRPGMWAEVDDRLNLILRFEEHA